MIAISLYLFPDISYSQQAWRNQFALDIGAGIPVGDYADKNEVKSGFGVDATYYLQMSKMRKLFLSASVGYVSFPIDYGKGSIQDWDASMSMIPITLGLRYNFKLTGLQPYVGFELGYYMQTISVETFNSSNEDTREDAGIIPKAGIRYPLMNQLDFDANIKYHHIFRDDDYDDFQYLGINIGVAYTIK